jgi:hypothetical protein
LSANAACSKAGTVSPGEPGQQAALALRAGSSELSRATLAKSPLLDAGEQPSALPRRLLLRRAATAARMTRMWRTRTCAGRFMRCRFCW